jgi:hypothetical protein
MKVEVKSDAARKSRRVVNDSGFSVLSVAQRNAATWWQEGWGRGDDGFSAFSHDFCRELHKEKDARVRLFKRFVRTGLAFIKALGAELLFFFFFFFFLFQPLLSVGALCKNREARFLASRCPGAPTLCTTATAARKNPLKTCTRNSGGEGGGEKKAHVAITFHKKPNTTLDHYELHASWGSAEFFEASE